MADYTLSARITGDASGLEKAFKTAQASLSNFGKKATLLGGGMTAGITVPFGKAVSSAVDFDTAMRKASTIAGATGDDFDRMSDCALKLGATTSLSSSEVATAMSEMAAKGYDVNEVIAAMPGVISAAEASGEDLSVTANTVSSAINGFGLAAEDSGHVSDVLAMSANKTAAGISDLGYAFQYAGPIASSLGISMEELSAATGIMADAGMEGSKAGTTLRMALSQLTSPTKEAAGLMEDLGFSAIDADGNFKPLNQIVSELNGSMEGMKEAQKQAALSTIFGTEAASGMNVLLSKGSDELSKLTNELVNSDGASKAAAESMKAGIGGSLENLSGAVESATISLMNELVPTLQAAAEKITGLVEKFSALPGGTKKIIAFATLGAAALGPLLAGIGVISLGLSGLVSVIGLIASPIGIVVAAISALAGGLVYLYNTNESVRNSIQSAWSSIQGTLFPVFQSISSKAREVFRGLLGFISSAFGTIAPIVQSAFGNILPVLQSVFGTIKAVIGAVADSLKGFFGGIQQGFTGNLSGAAGFTSILMTLFTIMSGGSPIIGVLIQLFKNFAPQMVALVSTIGGSLVPIFATLGTTIGGIASAILPAIQSAFASLLPVIAQIIGSFTQVISAVLPVLVSLFSQLAPFLVQVASMIGQVVAAVAPMVAQLVGALLPVITNIVQVIIAIVTAVMPAAIAIINVIMSVIQAVVPVITDILSVVISVISGVISAINPIISFIGMVITAIMSVVSPIITFVANIIATIVKVIGTVIGVVTGIFSTVFSIISGVFSNVSNFISTVITTVSTVISSLTGIVGGVFNGIYSVVSSVMSGVGSFISGIFNGIKTSWNGLTSFVSGVFGGVASAVSTLVSQVKGFVNGVIGGINGAIGLINKIPGVSIGAIPMLLHGTDDWGGGFARMNEGGRGELTYLPDGTQVIPHDISVQYAKESARANSGSGISIDYGLLAQMITESNYIYGEKVANSVVESIHSLKLVGNGRELARFFENMGFQRG